MEAGASARGTPVKQNYSLLFRPQKTKFSVFCAHALPLRSPSPVGGSGRACHMASANAAAAAAHSARRDPHTRQSLPVPHDSAAVPAPQAPRARASTLEPAPCMQEQRHMMHALSASSCQARSAPTLGTPVDPLRLTTFLADVRVAVRAVCVARVLPARDDRGLLCRKAKSEKNDVSCGSAVDASRV